MANVKSSVRKTMMDTLRSSILDVESPGKIRFYNSSGGLLCTLLFDDIVLASPVQLARYEFQYSESSPNGVLRQSVVLSGIPVRFTIGVDIIEGTVGVFGSDADIQFNTDDWSLDDAVSLSGLTIELPNP
jgi:hypothetical protein